MVQQTAFNNTKVHSVLKCPNMINPKNHCKWHPEVAFDPSVSLEQWKAIYAPSVYPTKIRKL